MVNCLNCNSEFIPTERHKKQKFCSRKCKIEFHSLKRREYKQITEKICPICNKKFDLPKYGHFKIYCSKNCKQKGLILKDIKKYREYYLKNYEKNKTRLRENARNNYDKNKDYKRKKAIGYRKKFINKWTSRDKTYKLLNLKRKKVNFVNKCKICGKTENLEVHHEIYPTSRQDIIKAILDNKIYCLCKEHHGILSRRYI